MILRVHGYTFCKHDREPGGVGLYDDHEGNYEGLAANHHEITENRHLVPMETDMMLIREKEARSCCF
jgi:hypothetical protein